MLMFDPYDISDEEVAEIESALEFCQLIGLLDDEE